MGYRQATPPSWIPITAILAGAVILVWLAPPERTLGEGIKVVYLHVALTWTGMLGILLAGALGLGAILLRTKALHTWTLTTGWVSLSAYITGFGVSLLASWINWGGIFWDEPRSQSALTFIAVALIFQTLSSWTARGIVRGLLSATLAAYLIWTTSTTSAVLHPSNALELTSSTSIRLTFLILFLLCCLLATWLALTLQHLRPVKHNV